MPGSDRATKPMKALAPGVASDLNNPALGECPVCAATVPVANLGITYRPSEAMAHIFAECPSCGLIVHPE